MTSSGALKAARRRVAAHRLRRRLYSLVLRFATRDAYPTVHEDVAARQVDDKSINSGKTIEAKLERALRPLIIDLSRAPVAQFTAFVVRKSALIERALRQTLGEGNRLSVQLYRWSLNSGSWRRVNAIYDASWERTAAMIILATNGTAIVQPPSACTRTVRRRWIVSVEASRSTTPISRTTVRDGAIYCFNGAVGDDDSGVARAELRLELAADGEHEAVVYVRPQAWHFETRGHLRERWLHSRPPRVVAQ